MLDDELREEIQNLGRLRLIGRRVVLHRLGPSDAVDADDERSRPGVLETVWKFSADPRASNETSTRAIEVRIRGQGGTVKFHELPLGVPSVFGGRSATVRSMAEIAHGINNMAGGARRPKRRRRGSPG